MKKSVTNLAERRKPSGAGKPDDLKGVAGTLLLSFLLLLLLVIPFLASSIEIQIAYVIREDDYEYDYD